jgi:hypothetical protein
MKKSLPVLGIMAFAGALSFLGGCSTPTKPSTEREIEVTPQVMGMLAVSSMNEQQGSASFTTGSGTSTLSENSGAVLPSTLAKTLAKSSASLAANGGDLTVDSSAIAQGTIKLMYVQQIAGGTEYDTLVLTLDSNIVSGAGSKVYVNGKIESYSIADLDNDGFVAGKPAVTNKARYYLSTRYTQKVLGHGAGESETCVLDINAGADHNFDLDADNEMLAASWVHLLGSDTLGYARYGDADNDGVLVKKGTATQSIVDVTLFERDPVLHPLVAWNALTMRVLTNGDTTQDQVIRINGKEVRRLGRVSTFVALDSSGDSTVTPNEMAQAIWTTEKTAVTDTVSSANVRIVYNPVLGLSHPDGNKYYEVHTTESDQIGIVRTKSLDFTTAEPYGEGRSPTSGRIVLHATFANDKTASLVADFAQGSFAGTYIGPDNDTLTVVWNANGDVVSSN